jgi:hypothetical protein
MKNSIAAAAFAMGSLLTCQWAYAQWVSVTDPEELRDLMSNRKHTVTTEDGKPWNMSTNHPNGQSIASGRGQEWARSWRIDGDQLCVSEHLGASWEALWLCRTWQRNAGVSGQYRSIGTGDTAGRTPIDIPKMLYIRVEPAPEFHKTSGKATG